MPTLLVIESSPRPASVSTSLTQKFVAEWQQKYPGGNVITRNLFAQPAPFVSEAWIMAAYTPKDHRTAEQTAALAASDEYIQELSQADTIVIGAPMHNFSISAPLKAWIDQIVRPGATFSIGEGGYKGLLDSKKKVIVASARGGEYTGELAFLDHQTPYLKTILGFIGLTDVHFALANNQSRAAEAAEAGLKLGTEQILALA
ncbi:FMN-dependent NADH-azoreductase [Acidisarcina polymorpha]|uniref:FMN dependent NADH:quinone oxidoreductase n=1 Tax=Acidisarcina polymorpha TaxID=2211140 RepID=A0A2Z5FW37_9BACT|nr:NAD(P)H-dependent oxidoreductase [Acidisarcina polymorpha]AXC10714.1 FMN-dependent NADH-azoreductase [Acidisarcina polymorpha]